MSVHEILNKESVYERLSADTHKLLTIAEQSGKLAQFSRNGGLEITDVHLSGYVTSGDLAVDRFAHSLASREFPQADILSEESHANFILKESQDVLVLDPIDGTRHYKDGGDVWSIVLSLIKNGELKSAVITQPDLGITTFAEKGVGTYCQKGGVIKQVRVNPETELTKCKIGLGAKMADPATRAQIAELAKQATLLSNGPYIIESSGFELSSLARGVGFSAYIHPHAPAWDKTAGMLLVREAGGIATGWPERDELFEAGVIVAANQELYDKVAELAMRYVN